MYMDLSTYGWFHIYVDGFLPHGAADEYNVIRKRNERENSYTTVDC